MFILTPSLSLSPVFRRQWPSLYEALSDCRPKRHKLRKLYIKQVPKNSRVILGGDHTPWPRLEAETLKDRTFQHGARVISGKPITLGHGYSTIAWIRSEKGSWALPLCHERITSFETPITKAAWQLRQITRELGVRPLSFWDSEYGCASFVNQTADIEADLVMRLRPNRCLWGVPPAYDGKGRPKKHGAKFKLSDPASWGIPVKLVEIDDPTLSQFVLFIPEEVRGKLTRTIFSFLSWRSPVSLNSRLRRSPTRLSPSWLLSFCSSSAAN